MTDNATPEPDVAGVTWVQGKIAWVAGLCLLAIFILSIFWFVVIRPEMEAPPVVEITDAPSDVNVNVADPKDEEENAGREVVTATTDILHNLDTSQAVMGTPETVEDVFIEAEEVVIPEPLPSGERFMNPPADAFVATDTVRTPVPGASLTPTRGAIDPMDTPRGNITRGENDELSGSRYDRFIDALSAPLQTQDAVVMTQANYATVMAQRADAARVQTAALQEEVFDAHYRQPLMHVGSWIPAKLTTPVDVFVLGGIAEPADVTATVDRDIYSADGVRLLIPRGSRLIGKTLTTASDRRVLTNWESVVIDLNAPPEPLSAVMVDRSGEIGVRAHIREVPPRLMRYGLSLSSWVAGTYAQWRSIPEQGPYCAVNPLECREAQISDIIADQAARDALEPPDPDNPDAKPQTFTPANSYQLLRGRTADFPQTRTEQKLEALADRLLAYAQQDKLRVRKLSLPLGTEVMAKLTDTFPLLPEADAGSLPQPSFADINPIAPEPTEIDLMREAIRQICSDPAQEETCIKLLQEGV